MSGDVQTDGPRDPGRDLRDLDRVREPGAEMIVFRGDEHLALAREPAPRTRVLDAIEIALEAQAERIGLLGTGAVPAPTGAGRARRERQVERVLTLLAALHAPTDERGRVRMRVLHLQLVHLFHDSIVPGG